MISARRTAARRYLEGQYCVRRLNELAPRVEMGDKEAMWDYEEYLNRLKRIAPSKIPPEEEPHQHHIPEEGLMPEEWEQLLKEMMDRESADWLNNNRDTTFQRNNPWQGARRPDQRVPRSQRGPNSLNPRTGGK
jgi:hypothetical protein